MPEGSGATCSSGCFSFVALDPRLLGRGDNYYRTNVLSNGLKFFGNGAHCFDHSARIGAQWHESVFRVERKRIAGAVFLFFVAGHVGVNYKKCTAYIPGVLQAANLRISQKQLSKARFGA